MMGWGSMGTGGFAMVLIWSVALLVLLGTALVIVVLVKAAARHEWTPRTRPVEPPRMTAEEELEFRYARGEIDATTLVQRRAVLRQP
jgi:uncharacterized membrane protein